MKNKIKENNLSITYPELAKQWHPTKNGELKPTDFTAGSGKKVWWICEYGHEWEATITNRTSGRGCPYCAGRYAIQGTTDLATTHPDIAKQWHPTQNGKLKPTDITAGSNKKVWWKCEEEHEWEAMINSRTNGGGCPYCSKNGTSRPEMRVLYYTRKHILANASHRIKIHKVEFDVFFELNGKKYAIEYDGSWSHKDKEKEDLKKNLFAQKNNIELYRLREYPLTSLNDTSIDFVFNPQKKRECEEVLERVLSSILKKEVQISFNEDNAEINDFAERVKREEALATQFPEIAKQWHPAKNLKLKPEHVTAGSKMKVWWKCEHGHEWEATINNRTKGSGCPYCSGRYAIQGVTDLATTHPDIAKQWHPTKNDKLKPTDITAGSGKKVWWQCEHGHEWQARINSRKHGSNCPYCSGQKTLAGFNDLATTHPDIAKQWHPTKNGDFKPTDVTVSSNKKVWWRGKCGHEWEATISNRTSGNGCPYCAGQKTLTGFNDLATTHPDIAKQWHPTKNGDFKPTDVTVSSNKKVWWRGKCGHEWEATISNRTSGNGCPYCSGRYAIRGTTDLATTHPDLAKQWHPTKNGESKPTNITAGSHEKVWWQCEKGHEWQTIIYNRTKGSGCPYCSGRYAIQGVTDLATTHPDIAKQWHPTKNDKLKPTDIAAGSGKKVWWQCEHGHEWETTVSNRSRYNSSCPICKIKERKNEK